MRFWYLILLSLCVADASAQTLIPNNNPQTQTFSAMGTSLNLPVDWKMSAAGLGATANWADVTNVTTTTLALHSAIPAPAGTGGRYNWGDGSSDRAIGFMTDANYTTDNSIMAFYRNATGVAIAQIAVGFRVERYRTNTNTFSLSFYVSSNGMNWVSVPDGDISTSEFAPGASAYDFSNPVEAVRTAVITINVPNNGDIYFKWVFTNTNSINSQGLGLDDVTVDVFTPPADANPNLPISCPYDFILVLDESGSIEGQGGAGAQNIADTLRQAARDLIGALNGTGTRVAVVEFSTDARRAVIGGSQAYQVVDNTYITNFNTYITGGAIANNEEYDPSGGTNWEEALTTVQGVNTSDGVADLVIFITDGFPTACATGCSGSPDPDNILVALQRAAIAANSVKAQGSHIFGVTLPNPSVPETNMQQISGPERYPDIQPDFIQGDYTVSSTQTLRDDLQRIAESVCRVNLLIDKISTSPACVGDTIDFTLVLSNIGLDNDTLVVVRDTIPNGFAYVSDDGGAATTLNGSTVIWTVPTLAGGGNARDTLNITVVVNPTGIYTNTAWAFGQQEEVDSSNNHDSFTVQLLNCNDGIACTQDDCENAQCVFDTICCITSADCDDGNLCTVDTCVGSAVGPSTCVFNDTICVDQNLCTRDTCINGVCTFPTITCNDGNACTTDACNPQTGCTTTPIVCNDGNACTTDGCEPRTGCTTTPIVCDDGSACTRDTCISPTGCTTTPVVCNDNNSCTSDTCNPQTGCVFTPNIICNDGNACTTDGCDPASGCTYTPIVCNDNSLCTTDGCNPLTGCTTTPIVCNDGDGCTTDGCNPQTGCTTAPVICDDNQPCTNDECVNGACVFDPIIVDGGDDETICEGDSVQLNATGGLTYSWSPATGLSATDTSSPIAFPTVTTSYVVSIQATGINVIQNGDFSSGATGFTSAYNLNTNLVPEGNYFVDDDPSAHHNNFSACDDHTTGTGDMLIVNGSGTPNTNVWCQTISITPNTDYAFSTWVTSVHPSSPARLQFYINGSLIGPVFTAPSTVCVWRQFFELWNSGADTTAGICIVNQNTVPAGNDFALDDISFAPICVIDDTVTVTVNEAFNDTVEATVCPGTSYQLPDGSFVNTSGIYPVTLTTADGCDSTIVTDLTVLDCDDSNECTTDACNAQTGCTNTGLVCNDNNACTTDNCNPQTGCTTTAIVCNDNDQCTTDGCNPQTGCTTTAIVCNDNNACTTDGCNPQTGCTTTAIICNDNNACTTDGCNPQTGCTTTEVVCNDNNACTTDGCNPQTGCTSTAVVCTDGNVCNGIETCDPATGCLPGTTLNCNDNNVCTLDSCDGIGGCFYTNVVCDDSNPCTTDNCVAPTAGCTFTPLNCSDGNLCTRDTCINGICSNPPLDCDDDSICTNDFCASGVCNHTPIANCCVDTSDCLEGGACAVEACIGNECYYTAVCCDDGDNCTWDYCEDGECVFVPKFCEDNNPCTDNSCINGSCDFPPLGCDDGNACTDDACLNGNCIHTTLICNDGNPCTRDFCDNGCRHVQMSCSDGDRCTRDTCIQGACVSFPITCNDNDLCTNDACVNGTCRYTPIQIDVTIAATGVDCGNTGSGYILNFAGLPHGTILNEQYAADGIHISAQAYPPGINELITYDTYVASSNFDLQVGIGNIAIFPANLTDNNHDGRVDNPNDTRWGGKQIFTFDWDRTVCSFLNVDIHNAGGQITAYDQFNNVILSVPLPVAPHSYPIPELVTVELNVPGVRKLVIDYRDQGGITDILLDCGGCNGTAQAFPEGGTAPYTYHWSNGQTSSFIDGLCAGTQCVTVSDLNGCTAEECVEIEAESPDCNDGDPCTEDLCVNGVCSFPPVEIDVAISRTNVCNCVSASPGQICDLDYAGLAHGTFLAEQYASSGIHVSAIANHPGKNHAIIFNTNLSGTPDPDLQVDIGNIVIIPFNVTDINPANGLVDNPNDNTTGGKITFLFDSPRTVKSFVFVDEENNNATGKAYDAGNNLIVSVPILNLGDASVQTVMMNASGVRKLVIEYSESGGVGRIVFDDCNTPCCDGAASASGSGGQSPYSYSWSNGSASNTINNLCEGSYCVTVTDANGCEEIECVNIVEDNSPNCGASKLGGGSDESNEAFRKEFEKAALSAYPNPFTDRLNIEFMLTDNSRAKLEIFNMSGQLLQTLYDGHVKASQKYLLEYTPHHGSPESIVIYRLKTAHGTYYGKAVMVRGDR